jgi:hypothetical protein
MPTNNLLQRQLPGSPPSWEYSDPTAKFGKENKQYSASEMRKTLK